MARQQQLTARAQDLARGSRADATRRSTTPSGGASTPGATNSTSPRYRPRTSRWPGFWPTSPPTGATEPPPSPPSPPTPPATVVDGRVLVRDGLRPCTIDGYRAAISVAHRSADAPNPCERETVRRVVAGYSPPPGPDPDTAAHRAAPSRHGPAARAMRPGSPTQRLINDQHTAQPPEPSPPEPSPLEAPWAQPPGRSPPDRGRPGGRPGPSPRSRSTDHPHLARASTSPAPPPRPRLHLARSPPASARPHHPAPDGAPLPGHEENHDGHHHPQQCGSKPHRDRR